MKTRCWIFALLLALGLAVIPTTRAVTETADGDRISRLIAQLASMRFSERQKASRELETIGASALAALRKATTSADMETSVRAKALIARIDKNLEAAAVLAPTRVRLVCKDMPVSKAVAALATKAKIPLMIAPTSVAVLANRKITLDTGDVTFWEALDLLCRKASLVETTLQANNNPVPMQLHGDLRGGFLPIQPRLLPARGMGGIQVMPARPIVVQRQIAFQPQGGVIIIDGSGQIVQPAAQNNGQIALADGKPEVLPTCYAGAFRVRARTAAGTDKKSVVVSFEIAAEPRHCDWTVVGNLRLENAADDKGQALTLVLEDLPRGNEIVHMNAWQMGGQVRLARMVTWNDVGTPAPASRSVRIQIKLGEKSAKVLKNLRAFLTVETKTPREDLIVVDNILKAAGKTAKGAKGGSIKVLEAATDQSGNYRVSFKLDHPFAEQSPTAAGAMMMRLQVRQVIINGGMVAPPPSQANLTLVDGKGVPFQMVGSAMQSNNGDTVQTLTFAAKKGHEPAKLVFSALRTVNVDVPLVFSDLKLP